MKNIAIVGTTEHKADAPYDDQDWEIWGLSTDLSLPRITRWHELHNIERKAEKEKCGYIAKLAKACEEGRFRVVIARPHPMFAKAEIFPQQEIIKRFGRYWTNTVSWQLGHALLEWEEAGRPDGWKLGIWGVDMAQFSEYTDQRPSVEYMLGIARGLFDGTNCELVITSKSDLVKSRGLYGIDDAYNEMAMRIHQRDTQLLEKRKMAEAAFQQATDAAQALHGAMTELNRWMESGALNGHTELLAARAAELQNHYEQAAEIQRQAAINKATVDGAIENQKWVKMGL